MTLTTSQKRALLGGAFLLVVLGANLIYIVASGQLGEALHALAGLKLHWLLVAALCMLGYLVFGTLAYLITIWIDPVTPAGIRDMASVEATGTFFGNLTPACAGAVPAQILRLTKCKLSVGEATAIQTTRFLVYIAAETALGVGLLASRFGVFLDKYGAVVWVNAVVCAGKVLHLSLITLACLFPGLVSRLGGGLLRWLAARGWLKQGDAWATSLDQQVQLFAGSFRRGIRHRRGMALIFFASVAQLSCSYIVVFFVLKAFGVEADFVSCWALGSMIQLIANAMPLPGGTGGVEASFALLVGPLLGASASAGYLVWRLVQFYAYTVLCAGVITLKSKDGDGTFRARLKRLLMQSHLPFWLELAKRLKFWK